MPQVPTDVLQRFIQELHQATKRLDGGKVALDSDVVRALIRANKDAAHRYVELHCVLAASQPGYLQAAYLVAAGYQVEFQDDSLTRSVLQRAEELNAQEHLQRLGFLPTR